MSRPSIIGKTPDEIVAQDIPFIATYLMICVTYNCIVLQKIFNWYAVSTFSIHPIGFAQALGLLLTVRLLKGTSNFNQKITWDVLTKPFINVTIVFIIGWIWSFALPG